MIELFIILTKKMSLLKIWNVKSQEFSVSPFVEAFQHILPFWNAF